MFDKSILKLPKINKLFIKLAAFSLLQAFAIILSTFSLSKLIVLLWHTYKGGVLNVGSVMAYVISFIFFAISEQIITYFKNKSAQSFSVDVSNNLRKKIINKVVSFGDATTLEIGSGQMVNLLNNGINQVRNYFQLIFIKVIDLSIIPWVVLIAIAYFNWKFALFLLLIFPVIIFFFVILGLAAQKKADDEYKNFKRLNNQFADVLHGMQTLKQLGLTKVFSKRIYKTSEEYRKSTMSTLRVAITSSFSMDFFTTLSIAVIAVFLGMDLMNGKIPLFEGLFILILSPQYFLPLRNFADDYHATMDGKNSYEELNSVLENKTGAVSKADIKNLDKKIELKVQNYNFEYEENIPALKKINFEVKGFKKIGLIGLSGSGKTTMLNNIAGILEGNGEVEINQTELINFKNTVWRNQLNYISQKPFLFNDTIKNNIKISEPEADDKQIETALNNAGLKNVDLNFVIDEYAQNISGGQAQRLSIAKAFIKTDKKIILLDEPTAHLDLQTELEIKKSLLKLFKNKLVFFATHRLHWVNNFDYLLVFKDGKIIEQGTPKKLKSKKTSYLNKLLKADTNVK